MLSSRTEGSNPSPSAKIISRCLAFAKGPGVFVLVASLADVIRSKSAADREKDRQALPRLYDLLAEAAARREAGDRGSDARHSEKMLDAFDSGIPDLAEDHDRCLAEDFDD